MDTCNNQIVDKKALNGPGKKNPSTCPNTAAVGHNAKVSGKSTQCPVMNFPIVGIGASAGGLEAFEAFFSGMPVDNITGMSFILVSHMVPDHKSILSELIQRYTRMSVVEVTDGMIVQPNCTYIIPPNRDMAFMSNTLHLLEPSLPHGFRLPINFFFQSLALDLRERAICIVLSGTGSDGAMGVRAVKDEGGMVMVQSPESTMYTGMPHSAIDTGLADYILLPTEMPTQIIVHATRAMRTASAACVSSLSSQKMNDKTIIKIFNLVNLQTGHDFSQYKSDTLYRRIKRRMAILQMKAMDDYFMHLQRTPVEVEALLNDILIGVTRFFRDFKAFEALNELVIPKLFDNKSLHTAIRIWVPGCSTGEEAYSLAILLSERMTTLMQTFKVQIFATDIDNKVISAARAGCYPASIVSDISPERLSRFFVAESGNSAFRVRKNIRDMVIFSNQDLTKDPPLSKIDLICCRNLLIYKNGEQQKKLLSYFHYALNPGGFLFLGLAETTNVEHNGDLFVSIDGKINLFQRKECLYGEQRKALSCFLPPTIAINAQRQPFAAKALVQKNLSLRELTEQAILRCVAPACALVKHNGDILYLHGRTGLFLEPAQGEAGVDNILKMAREGLWRDLTTALHGAVSNKEIVHQHALRVETNGGTLSVDITVHPIAIQGDLGETAASDVATLYLIFLEEKPSPDLTPAPQTASLGTQEANSFTDTDEEANIVKLKQELQAKEGYLQAANEEMETSNEELKSVNEELQSLNEEFLSANEELETSKEKLLLLNEELASLNAELHEKVSDLSRVNNDMNNLLAGSEIGTIFVDHSLNIMRYTPAAARIINLSETDKGRPVGHIVSGLKNYNRLLEDVQEVLDTLVPKEMEMEIKESGWFIMRIMPYRTLDNVIEGVVINFVDITRQKQIETALKRSESLLRTTQRLSCIGGWEVDVKKQTSFWTDEVFHLHDFEPGELAPDAPVRISRCLECYLPEDRPVIQSAFKKCLEEGKKYDLELRFVTVKGRKLWIRTFAEPVVENGKVIRVAGFFMDITESKLREEALQKALADNRILHGLLTACSSCKKIRDNNGEWKPMEVFVQDRTEA
jgi:two-component system, chemotaxis family, CheB/CheR fusion protein